MPHLFEKEKVAFARTLGGRKAENTEVDKTAGAVRKATKKKGGAGLKSR